MNEFTGSLGCGIGYGYLHRIPIRVLPDEKATTNKPFLGTAPISVPYVPPLANTFASTNVNTVPLVPNTGKSDAEIVFSGVANLNLNNAAIPTGTTAVTTNIAAQPINNSIEQQQQQQQQQYQQQHQLQSQQPIEFLQQPAMQPQSVELATAAIEQPVSSAPPNMQLPPTNYQHPSPFGTMPPTSIPSLNESFNIPPTINPSSVPSSVYQTNPMQCECYLSYIMMQYYTFSNYRFFFLLF